MDHPISSLCHRPWRTATLVASAVAAVELCILLILGVMLLSKPLTDDIGLAAASRSVPKVPAPKPKTVGPAVARLPRGETSVLVLNGNGRTGAAGAAADRVRARGYLIGGVGNARRTNYTLTTVLYRPGRRGEALRLARDLGVKVVGPLDGMRTSDLMGAHLALIVGA